MEIEHETQIIPVRARCRSSSDISPSSTACATSDRSNRAGRSFDMPTDMTIKYTPKELEQIVLNELGRQGELPDGLRLQILRTPQGWRPVVQAMPPDLAQDVRTRLASRITTVGGEVAQNHRLIGD